MRRQHNIIIFIFRLQRSNECRFTSSHVFHALSSIPWRTGGSVFAVFCPDKSVIGGRRQLILPKISLLKLGSCAEARVMQMDLQMGANAQRGLYCAGEWRGEEQEVGSIECTQRRKQCFTCGRIFIFFNIILEEKVRW